MKELISNIVSSNNQAQYLPVDLQFVFNQIFINLRSIYNG